MFTGLIEEVGVVTRVARRAEAARVTIGAGQVLQDLAVDDSIAISGVCLTAVAVHHDSFEVEAVRETMRKTTLGNLAVGSRVNLERALSFSARLGGHLVQGHVDSVGEVAGVQTQAGGGCLLQVRLPQERMKYVIPEGSITIDGVSLTVARINGNEITISLIPHTLEKTTLGALKRGDRVNIEVDLIGKYVENILLRSARPGLSLDRLKELGYPE